MSKNQNLSKPCKTLYYATYGNQILAFEYNLDRTNWIESKQKAHGFCPELPKASVLRPKASHQTLFKYQQINRLNNQNLFITGLCYKNYYLVSL